jgi:hypothetical protein
LTQAYLADKLGLMSAVVAAPLDWVESIGNLRFPSKADQRLQELMDLNNEGKLSEKEREVLEGLVELSERLSLIRAEAMRILQNQKE